MSKLQRIKKYKGLFSLMHVSFSLGILLYFLYILVNLTIYDGVLVRETSSIVLYTEISCLSLASIGWVYHIVKRVHNAKSFGHLIGNG